MILRLLEGVGVHVDKVWSFCDIYLQLKPRAAFDQNKILNNNNIKSIILDGDISKNTKES